MKKLKILLTVILIISAVVTFAACADEKDSSDDQGKPFVPLLGDSGMGENHNTYLEITENPFVEASKTPSSMFALSVSTAAYSNLRYCINNNQCIVPDQVNIEQLVNYFRYDYPDPQGDDAVSVTPSLFPCPWNRDAHLLSVGLKAKDIEIFDVRNNLVFLLDVSGSMYGSNRLDLVKQSFLLLLENLDENDTVSIVTYAGSDRVLLDGGNGSEKERISAIIEELSAGGSTAGANGIKTAYEIANRHFIEGGNNRVILATDGDFNVGINSTDALKDFIANKRNTGVYFSVLGFGFGNLRSDLMETLANNGNGSFAYIDSINEARKVLVEEIGGTLNIVAKDAKARVDFNPEYVDYYRLLGYENLHLSEDEWNDSNTDAGEIGTGFTVTAVYEVIFREDADLDAEDADFLTASVRYKSPDASDTTQYEITADCGKNNVFQTPTRDMAFISAIVETALVLRNSQYKGEANIQSVITRLDALDLSDNAYMEEFRELVKKLATR